MDPRVAEPEGPDVDEPATETWMRSGSSSWWERRFRISTKPDVEERKKKTMA